jgi:hypothetical protein
MNARCFCIFVFLLLLLSRGVRREFIRLQRQMTKAKKKKKQTRSLDGGESGGGQPSAGMLELPLAPLEVLS